MKKILAVAIAGLFMLTSSIGFAADAFKVGVVDILKALNESDAGKRAKADLEVLLKSKQSAIEEKGRNIERLRADIEKQAAIISAEAKKKKEEEVERLIRDYQRIVSDSQAEFQKKQRELETEIIKELKEILDKIGPEEGYSLILEPGEGGALYYNKSLDITDKIIKRYNESKAGKK
jgi:outer membrane protein